MTLSYALAIPDLVAFNLHAAFERRNELDPPTRIRQRTTQALLFLACFVLALRFGVWAFVAGVLLWHAVAWSLPPYARHRLTRFIRHLYSLPAGQAELGPQTLIAGADGLRSVVALSSALYDWRAVQRVATAPNHVFIYVGVSRAFIIPRAAVPAADVEAFLAAVRTYAPAAFQDPAA